MLKKLPLTVIVIAKNEANNLSTCLASLSFASLVIVADDHSTDDTVSIARSHHAKTITLTPTSSYADKRNEALAAASDPWILFVDADETVPPETITAISKAIELDHFDAYLLPRTDTFMGKSLHHGETGNIHLLRLAKRNAGYWERPVHEVWNTKGRVGKLSMGLLHTPHPNLASFLASINHYTELESHSRPNLAPHLIFLQLLTFPLGKFILNYFLLAGYLDGIPGLFHALFMSLHSLCVRIKWLELMLKEKQKQ